MESMWSTSINYLLDIFKGAVLSIIPWLDKAKINWKDEDAYDDWDNIVNALFENIVCSSIVGEVSKNYPIAKYNYHYDDYSNVDFIIIRSGEYANENLAFISFQSISDPFDNIKVAILNISFKVVKRVSIKNENIDFKFCRNKNGKKELIDNFDVLI